MYNIITIILSLHYIILYKTIFQEQEQINWENVTEENTEIFIPPIQCGKVLKVHSGDTITIATPIFTTTNKIYRFVIYLDSICAPKIIPFMNIQNDTGLLSKNALSDLICGKIVQIRDMTYDKHGKLYANVFMDNIHVNEWLLKYNYASKCKNGRKRRMSESDTHSDKTIIILPTISSMDTSSSVSSLKKEDVVSLPIITRQNTTSPQSDCFLSHNWGENHINHQRVHNINAELQKRGLKTWFDENKRDGNIRYKIAEGIDNTKCVVVFITKEYRDKVNGEDMKDNCKYEFSYAMNQLGSQNMVSVVMEPEMKETNKWKGELGAALGSMLFVDFSSSSEIYDELYKRIKHIINRSERKS